MMNSIFDTPYFYYIGGAYGVALFSGLIFSIVTLVQVRSGQKKLKSLENGKH